MIFYKTKFKHLAFTLAEVLITLGIIGIVAAMTIPTLYGSMQKRQTVAKLQKAISLINQAYKLSYNDNGDLTASEVMGIGTENYFNMYWAPYIKAEVCKTYTQCGYNSAFPLKKLNNTKYDIQVVAPDARTTFLTPEGSIFIILTYSGGDTINVDSNVFVDINGGKLPNTVGKDVFVLTRIQNEHGVEIVPLGNTLPANKIDSNCTKGGSGSYCAEKIRRAGWKIDATYPW